MDNSLSNNQGQSLQALSRNHNHSSSLTRILKSDWSCLFGGALMPLAFAPFYQGWLVFFALLPLLLACRHPNPDARVKKGALFGLSYFCISAYWFAQTLIVQLGYAWYTAIAANFVIAGACALAPTVFCWLAGYLRHLRRAWPLWLCCLWIIVEDIRFQAFGGGPWVSLGLSQVNNALAGFVPILGEVGTSATVILASYCLLRALQGITEKHHASRLLLPASVILLLMLSGQALKQVEWTHPSGKPLSIAMVQSATSQKDKWLPDLQYDRLQQLSDLSRPFIGKSDLIVWPETVVILDRKQVRQALLPLDKAAMQSGTTLLVGAFESSLQNFRYNTAFTLGLEAGQVYKKRHLVPFGEYIPPLMSFLDGEVPGDHFREIGKQPVLMAIRGQLLGNSICWEGSFSRDNTPLVQSGANLLVNIANEAWFAGSPLPGQNLDAMRLRAMENGRPAVRVANYGPGGLIDAHGNVLTQLEADHPGGKSGSLQPMQGITPFVFLGADFILALASAIAGIIVVMGRRKSQ